MSTMDEVSVGGRRRRRRLRAWALAGAGALVLVVAAVATFGLGTGRSEKPAVDPRLFQTVPVTRADLVEYTELKGEVGYGAPVPMRSEATGTVTWIAPGGDVVSRGETLLRVNDQPVVLLYGSLPMFRTLAEAPRPAEPAAATSTAGAAPSSRTASPAAVEPTTGNDVKQFEENLRSLGYHGFTVDDEFTAETAKAVKRWQHDLGKEQTGRVEPGDVVYAPAAVRIAQQSVRVGAAVPADVLTWTGTTRVVTATAEQGTADWATSGAEVTVVPDGGKAIRGTVDQVGADPTTVGSDSDTGKPAGSGDGDAATPQISITVTVADQEALRAAETGAVDVRRIAKERKQVLTVPVSALLALAEGGYGLEVVHGAATRTVAVKAGMFADGRVEVTGDGLAAGLDVRIPQ